MVNKIYKTVLILANPVILYMLAFAEQYCMTVLLWENLDTEVNSESNI